MLKRRLMRWGGVTVLGLLAGTGTAWLVSPDHAIGTDAYYGIRVGMTLDEVQALIGFRPGDYCKRGQGGLPVLLESEGDTTPTVVRWAGSNDCWIIVWLDDHQLVVGKCRCGMDWQSWEPPTFTDRLRAWLDW